MPFADSEPEFWAVNWLSAERLEPYLRAVGGDPAAALALYTWNGRVSVAVFRDLADLEVLVRNAYHRARSTRASPATGSQTRRFRRSRRACGAGAT